MLYFPECLHSFVRCADSAIKKGQQGEHGSLTSEAPTFSNTTAQSKYSRRLEIAPDITVERRGSERTNTKR